MSGWVVLTTNQASGLVAFDEVSFHGHEDEAREVAQSMAVETAACGRRERHYVARVDDDWGRVSADGTVTW